jgi:FkbM family methyltransferase
MYYGQRDMDKVIEEYFYNQNSGYCIEVGAYDGIKGSNTKYFENLGWKTLCIEPNKKAYHSLEINRVGPNLCCACSNQIGWGDLEVFDFQSGIQSSLTSLNTDPRLIRDYGKAITNRTKYVVPTLTLDFILNIFNITNIDFISIDTEGTELDVLHGLNLEKYRPKLLVIEENYEEDMIIREYLAKNDYTYHKRYFINNFYIDGR